MKAWDTSKPIFVEEQSFTQHWMKMFVTIVIVLAIGVIIFSSYMQLYRGIPFDKKMSDAGLVIYDLVLLILGVITPFLLLKVKLVVILDTNSLHIQFWPFINKTIPLYDVVSFEGKSYKPIREYGGWGLRYSFRSKSWAYTVSGNRGVFFVLSNGKKFLIGSQHTGQFVIALSKLKDTSSPASSRKQ